MKTLSERLKEILHVDEIELKLQGSPLASKKMDSRDRLAIINEMIDLLQVERSHLIEELCGTVFRK